MTRREELEHRAATHCRECLASFETAEKKLHHCHGTGQYLGALCHSCNIAAQTPKTIPVVFHNGGGYDFHFLLRCACRRSSIMLARLVGKTFMLSRTSAGPSSSAGTSRPTCRGLGAAVVALLDRGLQVRGFGAALALALAFGAALAMGMGLSGSLPS